MNETISVLDVGARYGLHPTWRGLAGCPVNFILVDADEEECQRLNVKYNTPRHKNTFSVIHCACSDDTGKLDINLLDNRAMSGAFKRRPSRLFSHERQHQEAIVAKSAVNSVTIDSIASSRREQFDFFKIDIEGGELKALRGGSTCLRSSVLGVRAEVSFNGAFIGGPSFCEIQSFMDSVEFSLLNIDFLGYGEAQHKFASVSSRHGIINRADAVWIKSKYLEFPFSKPKSNEEVLSLLKVCIFAVKNNAPDLALALMEESHKQIQRYGVFLKNSKLFYQLSLLIEKYLYSLKWIPGQSESAHARTFEKIFSRKMRTGTQFMSSEELNP